MYIKLQQLLKRAIVDVRTMNIKLTKNLVYFD